MLDGEFEKDKDGNWQKTSNVGDSIGVDFYHSDQKDKTGNQITYVTDRKGNWNTIKNGKELLANSEIRDRNTDWNDIYNEWSEGYGPEKSIFEGSHPANKAIHDNYLYRDLEDKFLDSGKSKGAYEANFYYGWDNYWTYNNMQVQMMGSYNASFYKLGDTVLNLIQDSKSRTSFYYHLPVDNYPRGSLEYNFRTKSFDLNNRETNTFQTYLFLTTKK
ncbi:hypothetical protein B0A78_13635 [Flavobacterium columnare NBRC 100251 = ATCC 23463]|nr:hypothetical protein [Flavobacterium columnare]PDS21798.1 hypothetical protein B0A78_13635 [Flavobacterium columnare NBRC 100251 = ATCC 23463]